MSKCEARQYSDQMQCGRCGLAWDMNDPSPPPCGQEAKRERGVAGALKALAQAGARAGLITDRANEARKPRPGVAAGAARELFSGPERRQLSAATVLRNAEPSLGEPVAATLVIGSRTPAEEWMRQAVGRGEVLRVVPDGRTGPAMLMIGDYCMPAELPDEAALKMAIAVHGAPGYPGESEGMRIAYRELLAYLGQA